MVSQFQIENFPMPGGKSGPKSRFYSHGAIRQGDTGFIDTLGRQRVLKCA